MGFLLGGLFALPLLYSARMILSSLGPGELFAIGTSLTYSGTLICVRQGMRNATPAAGLLVIGVVVSAAGLAASALQGHLWNLSWKAFLWFVATGTLGMGMGNLLAFMGVQRMGVSRATPVADSALGRRLRRDLPRRAAGAARHRGDGAHRGGRGAPLPGPGGARAGELVPGCARLSSLGLLHPGLLPHPGEVGLRAPSPRDDRDGGGLRRGDGDHPRRPAPARRLGKALPRPPGAGLVPGGGRLQPPGLDLHLEFLPPRGDQQGAAAESAHPGLGGGLDLSLPGDARARHLAGGAGGRPGGGRGRAGDGVPVDSALSFLYEGPGNLRVVQKQILRCAPNDVQDTSSALTGAAGGPPLTGFRGGASGSFLPSRPGL
ncbi:MAG: DMT family transporter [Candidatus Tectomicrobia bacterium]|uniref:DMT family transporter n=1 Tax=Tectimicrobiota bacterium TaxID=2528274 RepID=A0A932I248_UNCTE|nr:DMT family transporter [Candidatus Tectomicrobia bacterium]